MHAQEPVSVNRLGLLSTTLYMYLHRELPHTSPSYDYMKERGWADTNLAQAVLLIVCTVYKYMYIKTHVYSTLHS